MAFVWREVAEELTDAFPGFFGGSFGGFAKQMLELCEELLDWIEVGAVGGEKQQSGAGGADRRSHGFAFMASQIV